MALCWSSSGDWPRGVACFSCGASVFGETWSCVRSLFCLTCVKLVSACLLPVSCSAPMVCPGPILSWEVCVWRPPGWRRPLKDEPARPAALCRQQCSESAALVPETAGEGGVLRLPRAPWFGSCCSVGALGTQCEGQTARYVDPEMLKIWVEVGLGWLHAPGTPQPVDFVWQTEWEAASWDS